jgi:hypothetical protein
MVFMGATGRTSDPRGREAHRWPFLLAELRKLKLELRIVELVVLFLGRRKGSPS